MELIPTASQTIGPFFHVYLDAYGSADCLAGKEARGDHVRIDSSEGGELVMVTEERKPDEEAPELAGATTS